MKFRFSVLTGLFAVVANMYAQDSLYVPFSEFKYADNQRYTFLGGTPRINTDIQLWPTVGMAGAFSALVVTLHVNQANAWWKDQSGGWRIVEDISYARGLDKFGHVYSGYLLSSLFGDMLMECGLSLEPSVLTGAGMGIAYMTYVEVNDGFAKDWGFSPTDAISNVVGVGYYLAQHYWPFLENFTPRWSYIPPEWTGDRKINKRPISTFIDDYNGTTFWLAVNVNRLLPQAIEPYWPDWMMISVGYGIRNYAVIDALGRDVDVSRKFLIGIDYDWIKIIPPSDFGFFNYVRQFMNYVRFPGPTLEIGDDGVSFGLLYPFAIVIPL